MDAVLALCEEGDEVIVPTPCRVSYLEMVKLSGADSFALADFLLEEAGIIVVPGGAFEAPDNLRISCSNSMESLITGMNRMEEALKKLK